MSKDQCPHHGQMRRRKPRNGFPALWVCPVHGCTVKCWDGPTSTPADAETRNARKVAHDVFDRLWLSGRMTRDQAYRMLQAILDLDESGAHIGRLDRSQCERVVEALRGWDLGESGAAKRRKAC